MMSWWKHLNIFAASSHSNMTLFFFFYIHLSHKGYVSFRLCLWKHFLFFRCYRSVISLRKTLFLLFHPSYSCLFWVLLCFSHPLNILDWRVRSMLLHLQTIQKRKTVNIKNFLKHCYNIFLYLFSILIHLKVFSFIQGYFYFSVLFYSESFNFEHKFTLFLWESVLFQEQEHTSYFTLKINYISLHLNWSNVYF